MDWHEHGPSNEHGDRDNHNRRRWKLRHGDEHEDEQPPVTPLTMRSGRGHMEMTITATMLTSTTATAGTARERIRVICS
jgi:hypothetical protein